jgi:hypothetical protein
MLCELSDVIFEVTGLLSAARGRVTWVEIEDDLFVVFHVFFQIVSLTT